MRERATIHVSFINFGHAIFFYLHEIMDVPCSRSGYPSFNYVGPGISGSSLFASLHKELIRGISVFRRIRLCSN